jgi:hypothetical protein
VAPGVAPGVAGRVIPGLDEPAKRAAPLLREGTFIRKAPGVLTEDPKTGEWTFKPNVIESADQRPSQPQTVTREFTLLPNEPLGEAARTARLAPGPIAFEVSGEVFIYHGRNYLLPSLLTAFVPTDEPDSQPAPSKGQTSKGQGETSKSTAAAAPTPSTADEESIANELERKLAERIDRRAKPAVDASPARQEGGRTDAPPSTKEAPMRSDTLIQSRRGQLLRDNATGGWRFVFDGQLAEGGEPSMAVLPCLALERVESMVRKSDQSLALLVTGTTTTYEGRAFLLPTIFRVARAGKGINP